MEHIMLTFEASHGRLHGRHITARDLHGMLFNLLNAINYNEANWLHHHPSPKPFSLVPLYTEKGILTGMRLAAITKRVGHLMKQAWQAARNTQTPLSLGRQKLTVSETAVIPGPKFATLANRHGNMQLGLRFLSPTTFRQGPGSLPLPLPMNVFRWPLKVWQTYSSLPLPEDWLSWCERDVFVVEHQIQTATVAISKRARFTGFVGEVWFCAKTRHSQAAHYLSIWQGLTDLATFCGIGYKTTMGMGAVERIDG